MGETPGCPDARPLADAEIAALEPLLSRRGPDSWFLPECSVDPRGLSRALIQACKHRGVDFVTGSPAVEVLSSDGHATGVKTTHSEYAAGVVVNCCRSMGGSTPAAADSDAPGERPDGLPRAARPEPLTTDR